VEASEGLNYWQTIETSALAEVADLPHESGGSSSSSADRRHSLDIDRNAKKPTSE
jgi:hypothetical protein